MRPGHPPPLTVPDPDEPDDELPPDPDPPRDPPPEPFAGLGGVGGRDEGGALGGGAGAVATGWPGAGAGEVCPGGWVAPALGSPLPVWLGFAATVGTDGAAGCDCAFVRTGEFADRDRRERWRGDGLRFGSGSDFGGATRTRIGGADPVARRSRWNACPPSASSVSAAGRSGETSEAAPMTITAAPASAAAVSDTAGARVDRCRLCCLAPSKRCSISAATLNAALGSPCCCAWRYQPSASASWPRASRSTPRLRAAPACRPAAACRYAASALATSPCASSNKPSLNRSTAARYSGLSVIVRTEVNQPVMTLVKVYI